MEFQKFDKIPRLSRDIVITEKIDGTNAQIRIEPIMKNTNMENDFKSREWAVIKDGNFLYGIVPGSRNKWISPKKDNYGFAKWVFDNSQELLTLGIGSHFGEWYGHGIQRNYGLTKKKLALFNVAKWEDPEVRPKCCGIVPVLYRGEFDTAKIQIQLDLLENCGSRIVEGFKNPEGIVIYHTASGKLFKKTILNDEKPKG